MPDKFPLGLQAHMRLLASGSVCSRLWTQAVDATPRL
jgi:hypothetical protein